MDPRATASHVLVPVTQALLATRDYFAKLTIVLRPDRPHLGELSRHSLRVIAFLCVLVAQDGRSGLRRRRRGSFRPREREFAVTSVTDKQKETQDLLYGGRVTNPKELSDLQKESEYLKRRRASLEEKQIEAMITVEELVKNAAIANEEFVVVEAAWRTENAELVQEYDELKHELAQLIAKRKAFAKQVPAFDLEEYNSLRRTRCEGGQGERSGDCTIGCRRRGKSLSETGARTSRSPQK